MEGRGVFKDDGPGELSIDIAKAKSEIIYYLWQNHVACVIMMRIEHRIIYN